MVRVPTPSDLNETEEKHPRTMTAYDPPIIGYRISFWTRLFRFFWR